MPRSLFTVAAVALLAASAHAANYVRVPIRVEPAQPVRAIALEAAGEVRSFEIRDGVLIIPSDLPMPWKVSQLRFEPTTYSKSDLERKAPLVLRELGELRVRLRAVAPGEKVRGFLLRSGETAVIETALQPGEDGALCTPLAAGIYAAAFVGDTRATRIRSGIVITPGQPTEIGDLAFEPTGSVALRVLDARSKHPVRGARVTWAPAEGLNANVARQLFSRVWSGTTDRSGTIVFRSIGPPPLPATWKVEAPEYAPGRSSRVLIADTKRVVAPDVTLHAESLLIVKAVLPSDADDFRGALLVLSEPESDDSPQYEPIQRQPLREGENRLKLARFGRMRLSIESRNGQKLFFHDLETSPDDLRVTIAPTPTAISGVVERGGKAVKDAYVKIADGRDHRMVVGKTTTDGNGRYRLTTFQTGEVLIYTNDRLEDGTVAEPMLKTRKLGGEPEVRVDFKLPVAGATLIVVDAESGAPLRAAQAWGQSTNVRGVSTSVSVKTDDRGIGRIAGARDGTATVFVRSHGYRGREVTFDIREDIPEVRVALTKGGVTAGRIVDDRGAPVAGARVLGGFSSFLAPQGHFETTTDASGKFDIKGGPEPGIPFYVVARGYAVAIAYLREGAENVVRLARPNAGVVTVLAGHAPPKRFLMLLPAPLGTGVIPFGVFRELALLNGVSPFQLLSTGADGTFILPEFLAPGDYTLYKVVSTGTLGAEKLERMVDFAVPARPGTIVTIPEQP